jgi:hypothetical protein
VLAGAGHLILLLLPAGYQIFLLLLLLLLLCRCRLPWMLRRRR